MTEEDLVMVLRMYGAATAALEKGTPKPVRWSLDTVPQLVGEIYRLRALLQNGPGGPAPVGEPAGSPDGEAKP